jgi:endoglucanase
MWKFNNNIENQLTSLLNICTPSSMEMQTAEFLRNDWKKIGLYVKTDVMGNVYGILNPTSNFTIGLVAHIDVVSIQITKVLDNGLLLFRRIGTSLCSLIGKRVYIVSGSSIIQGIIGYDPLDGKLFERALSDEDLWIDIGTESKKESLTYVNVGDFAVYEPHYNRIGRHKICSAGLDNRIGVFIAMEIMKWFSRQPSGISLCTVGSVQEEIGLRGAQIIGNNTKMDVCFVIDVDFATDIITNKDKQTGELILGKGVGLCRKADNNIVLQSIIKDVAGRNSLPCQINLGRNIYGNTDAASLQLQGSGIPVANISIPCRYMHSSNEICDIRDVECAVNLLIRCIEHIDKQGKRSFIPGID